MQARKWSWKPDDTNRSIETKWRDHSGDGIGVCRGCLEKQLKIDRLEEELRRLKAKLRYQQRTASEGQFGGSTPSSKLPFKNNSMEEHQARKGGATPGHRGHGRKSLSPKEADRVTRVQLPSICPDCGTALRHKGTIRRTVLDGEPVKIQKQLWLLELKQCPKCKRLFRAKPRGVLPKGLFSNRLLSIIAVQHYVYGITLGQLAKQLGIGCGAIIAAMHGLSRRLKPAIDKLIKEYKTSFVKHADETGWRNDGRNGYVWLFCTPLLSIFRIRASRAARVAKEVLGEKRLAGSLIVDRYNAYNKAPCKIQYCYAHLCRDVKELAKQFPDNQEVAAFVQALVPQLTVAMKLRNRSLSKRQFLRQARQTVGRIKAIVNSPAAHPAIQYIQNIFREKSQRMYRWALDARIPAENNLAERELRQLVIARKISFGSQSDAGAYTREILMSVLLTLKKRGKDPVKTLTAALDTLAVHPTADVYRLLFTCDSS